MTYDEFKTYLMTHLWKTGDSLVLANLPVIIRTAEVELNRSLKVEDRVTVADLAATSTTCPLPLDYQALRSLSSPQRGEMTYNIPADFAEKKAVNRATGKDYTVVNNNIRLIGNISVEAPVNLECWYYRKIMPIEGLATGPYWLMDDYFDVLLYCVLKHSAPFLREDERIPVWTTMFNEAINSAITDSDERKYAGSPLKIKMKGVR